MSTSVGAALGDLLAGTLAEAEVLAPGALLLRGFARDEAAALVAAVTQVAAAAPLRQMITPGGYRMSVAMTNCGAAGWVTDRAGYRYAPHDPETGKHWPAMPASFLRLAQTAAEDARFPNFSPDACLINRYEPGAKLSLHQDKDERDYSEPIVSVSLGLPAVFLWGGLRRSDRPRRLVIESGDVAVWGGPSRFTFHGIAPLTEGEHPLTGSARINLTLRKAL